MRRFYIYIIFFIFGVCHASFAQDFFAVQNGNWNNGATWGNSSPGVEGIDWPSSGDDVSTESFSITLPRSNNFTCNTLFFINNVANQLIIGPGRGPLPTLTIQEAIISDDGAPNYIPTAPTVQIFNSNIDITFTGEKVTGFSGLNSFLGPWSTNCVFGDVIINQLGASTVKLEEILPISTSITISNGQFDVGSSGVLTGTSGTETLNVNSGTTLLVNGAVNGNNNNSLRFNDVNIQGNALTGTSGFINSNNFSLGSSSIFTVNFNGSNQTRGWWYQNAAPVGTFNIDPSSEIIYNSSLSQVVGALQYGKLTLRSPGGASTKNLESGNSLVVTGTMTINSANVTFDSSPNTNPVTISGNLVNNGTWSPSQLVIFDGTVAQSISGNNSTSFNAGIRVSNTTGVTLSNIGTDINGELDVDPSCIFNPADQVVNISGNMRVDGTLTAGTDPGGFIFDGTTIYLGSGTRNFNDLTISNTMTAPAATLFVNGDFANNGTFNNGGGTIAFAGSDTKIISGGSNTAFNNLNLTAGALQVASNVDLQNVMTISASTTFDADGASNTGVFTLKSDGTTDGAIATIPASATISGNFTAERFIDKVDPSLDRGYHIFGSSLVGVTVADIQSELPINGTFTGASAYTGPGGNNPSNPNSPSLYRYVESTGGGISARYVAFPSTNSSATFTNGEGYSLFTFTGLAPVTINGRGTLKRNAFSRALSFTGSGADAGWHTVANPYPAPTDWVAWGKTNVEGSTAYIYDPTDGSYTALDGVTGQQLIPRGQGFFVRVTSAGSVSATEATKVTGTTPDFFRQSNKTLLERFEIVLKRDSSEDIAIVSLQEGATDAYEGQYDATRLLNILETLSTKSTDGKNLKVNRLAPANAINGCSRSIYLNMEQMRVGIDYKLEFRDLDHLPMYSFELVDHFLNQTTSIQNGVDISFNVTSDLASKGSDRFELVLLTKAPNAVMVNDKEFCASERAVFDINNSQSQVTYLLYQDEVLLNTIEGMASSTPFEIESDNIMNGLNNFTLKASALNCDTVIVAEFTATKEIPLDLTVSPTGSEVCSSEESASFTLTTQNLVNYFITVGQDTLSSFVGTGNAYTGDITVADLNSGVNNLLVRLEKEGCESGTLDEVLSIIVSDKKIDESISYFGSQVCDKNDASVLINSQADIDYSIFSGTQKVESFTGDGNQQSILIPSAFLTAGTNQFSLQASYKECATFAFKKPIEVIVDDKKIDESISYFGTQVCDKNDATVLINSQADIDYSIFAGTQKVESFTGDGNQQSIVIPIAFLTTGTNQFNLQASYKDCASFTYSNPIEVIVDDKKIDESISYFGTQVCDKNDATVLINSQSDIDYTLFAGLQKVESFTGDGNQQSVVIPSAFLTTGTNQFSLQANYKDCESYAYIKPIEVIVEKDINTALITETTNTCIGGDAEVIISNAAQDLTYYLIAESDTVQIKQAVNSGQLKFDVSNEKLSLGSNAYRIGISNGVCVPKFAKNDIEIQVFEEATLSAIVSESNICLGETIEINVTSNLPTSNYQLLTENGTLIMENQSGVFNVKPIENVSYLITGTTVNGCLSNQLTVGVTVDVLEIPTIKSNGNILSVESNGDKYQWYKDGVIIEGENIAILVVEESGNYTVEITNGACIVLSDSFNFDASILSNLEKLEAMVSIHPNPVSSQLMIDFEGAAFTEAKISIFTLSGRFVNRYTVGKSTNIIDLTSLERGTYLIQLDTELGFLTKRIVKN